jgi:ribonucleotide reductase beta subunit family protein with ferritin-like domain
MIKPPDNLKTMGEKREWLERALPISKDLKRSRAYRTLSDESKIILMLMLEKQKRGGHD